MTIRVLTGDCRELLKTLPDESVHCVVTSPPYFGLRDYGCAGQIGLEPTPDAFVAALLEAFREVRRVLREDGTVWLNLGDSYNSGAEIGRHDARESKEGPGAAGKFFGTTRQYGKRITSLKPKDLIGIPWRVAFALQADGWYLRQDIIWSKPNPMPESVTDRCTKAHEYLFLLSKSERYFYDAEAIQEPFVCGGDVRMKTAYAEETGKSVGSVYRAPVNQPGRNKRSVWEVATQPFSEAHFATFPPDLIEPCIRAGCPEKCCAKCGAPWRRDGKPGLVPSCECPWDYTTAGGTVLDPFGGARTTGLVADRLGRNAILIELNPEYAEMAKRRISGDCPMFAEVA